MREVTDLKQCLKMAKFIEKNMPKDILETYDHIIAGTAIEDCICEQLKEIENGISKPLSLDVMIGYCVFYALSGAELEEAIKSYHEIRRLGKKNWMLVLKEELNGKPRNPCYLRKYAESVKQMDLFDRNFNADQTVEDIMQIKFREIESWRENTAEPLTNFFFLNKKRNRSIAIAFVNDVTYESLIVIKQYSYNGSMDGFNIKYPIDLSEHPIFNFRTTGMEFQAVFLENELSFLNEYQFESDEDGVTGKVTVKYNPEEQIPEGVTEKNLPQVLRNMSIELKQKELDTRDCELATILFNEMNGDILSTPYISMNMKDLAMRLFHITQPRKRHYVELVDRLKKLKSYDYTITLKKKDSDEVLQTTIISLLSYLEINYVDNTLRFSPSDQWKSTYVQKKYINLLADSYNSITSAQTKSIMMILQQERLKEYSKNSNEIVLTLRFFRSHMKWKGTSNSILIRELNNHLLTLQEKGIVIKFYEFINKNSAVHIKFLPLEERELMAYDYDVNKLDNTIESKYKEIE